MAGKHSDDEPMTMNTEELKTAGRARRWIVPVGVIVVLLMLGYGLLVQAPIEGKPAPDFTLSLFDGGEASLNALRGQVVVLNFWASWCAPCREEAPALERTWRAYKDQGVIFLGVNAKDVSSKGQAFIQQFGITYPNGADTYSRISKAYRVSAFPETFVINRDGRVAARLIGAVSEARLRAVIEQTVGGG